MMDTWNRSGDEVLSTLQDVVAIESVNPSLPGGDAGEVGMVAYLSRFFEVNGIPFELSEVLPGRSNIVATLEGEDSQRALLFECHMDTASTQVMTIPPFKPHIRDGLLYGRGSCDTKAGGVAMIHAMKRLVESGLRPPRSIVYAGVVDEEHLMRGSRHLAAHTQVEAAVVAEPTSLEVIRAHKGLVRFNVVISGKAAHSSKPHLGVNAISKMARLIVRIEAELGSSFAALEDPLLGNPTLNIGTVSGGVQINFVPDRCEIAVDCRLLPGQTPKGVLSLFEQLIAQSRAEDAELEVEIEAPFMTCSPLGTAEDAPIVQNAAAACNTILGYHVIGGVPYGTDGSALADYDVPTIVLGPGSIDQAHGAVEWVECEQVLRAVDIYESLMRSACAE